MGAKDSKPTKVVPAKQQASKNKRSTPSVERLTIDNPKTLVIFDRLPPQVRQQLASLLLGENCDGSRKASVLAAAEQWNDENPNALPTLELLPEELLDYIASHILGGESDSADEAYENKATQTTFHEHPKLSALENLPTEVLQQLAQHLICGNNRQGEFSRYDGLLEFRSVSRTIRTKTDHVFVHSFNLHAVRFSKKGIVGLFELSNCEPLKSQIQTLVFRAPKDCEDDRPSDNTYWQRVNKAIEIPEVRDMLCYESFETALLAVALRRLSLRSVFVAPSLNKLYPEELCTLEASTSSHPPTIIFNAIMRSEAKVQHLNFKPGGWGTYHGIRPTAMRLSQTVLRHSARLEALTELTLNLTADSGLEEVSDLHAMLEKCSNLTKLSLSLDKKTTEEFWPDLTMMRTAWTTISSLRWPKLTNLALTGFAITMSTLQPFLDYHKTNLSILWFSSCFLFGNWVFTFRSLKSSPTLKNLILDQISSEKRRVVWKLTTDDDNDALDEEDKDEWVRISTIGMRGIQICCRNCIDRFIGRGHISVKDANPRALDALRWEEIEIRP
ncbi:hypothetical protein FB567DRAFT_54201 [Paraphoma chrysanthemicola]|uniref:Uncharacterized protein n=1 Tax=Paraphoma chrysanthemicola TaxID=798071 RepID=A0A8K0VYJ1_9PLEO|nr:hypothetical protein FB567DRAFT_54201 [Paraphoma chrysanthemicola]